MLSRGSTTSGSHTWLEAHEADFTGWGIAQSYDYKTISKFQASFSISKWSILVIKKM